MAEVDERAAVSAYIKARLAEEQRERGRGYQAEVCRATGLKGSFVANLINHSHKGVGLGSAPAFAAFWKMSLSDLINAAMERAKTFPVSTAPSSGRYPNLAAAIEFVGASREIPDDALEQAKRIAQLGPDFAPGTWIVMLEDMIQRRSTAGRPQR